MRQTKKFQRKIEDFVCEQCGQAVLGTGYTDHCPNCLWSKHVDINPGDRAASCGGLMEPVSMEIKGGRKIIYYQCQRCSFKHRVKVAPEDSLDAIIKLWEAGLIESLEYDIIKRERLVSAFIMIGSYKTERREDDETVGIRIGWNWKKETDFLSGGRTEERTAVPAKFFLRRAGSRADNWRSFWSWPDSIGKSVVAFLPDDLKGGPCEKFVHLFASWGFVFERLFNYLTRPAT